MPNPRKSKTFVAATVAEAERQLAEWRRANPDASIVVEQEPLSGIAWEGSGRKQIRITIVSISIEYED